MKRALVALLLLCPIGAANASPARLVLEPAATRISFRLGATLHTVEGWASVLQGEIRFDTAGGPASGRIVVDARSAGTGKASRDEGMHEKVLETERFPEIVFAVAGLEVLSRTEQQAEVRLSGRIEIHGGVHPLTIPATLAADGDRVRIDAHFEVPYVKWGMKDPSVFVMRVAKSVQIEIHAEGRLEAEPTQQPSE